MPTWCPCVAPHAALVGSTILAPSHSRPLGTMPTIGSGFEFKKMGKCGWGRWSELYLVRRAPTKIVYGWLSPPPSSTLCSTSDFFSLFPSASVTTAGALECLYVTVAKSDGQFAPRNMALVHEDTYH